MSDFIINRRNRRVRVSHPAFSPKSPQVMQTRQAVSPTGAAIAIRPPRTAIRRMDNRGVGEVGLF